MEDENTQAIGYEAGSNSVMIATIKFDIEPDYMTEFVEERVADEFTDDMDDDQLRWLNEHGGAWELVPVSVDADLEYGSIIHTVQVSIRFAEPATAQAFATAFSGA